MNNIIEKDEIKIENMIYEIRGKQVMLDSDLSNLYGTTTKRINESVKRNLDKFPERFSWILTKQDLETLWSQSATANISKKSRSIPRVFTEQGVAMLATILKTSIATQVSIAIMDAFVEMKKYVNNNLLEQKYINNQVMKNKEDIKLLQESFKQFEQKKQLNDIFFEGQIYDSYSLLIDILNSASKNIIIIDNYIDKKFLDVCSKTNKDIVIYTNKINKTDFEKYNKQYKNITVKIITSFHDRFIILDNIILYHCGASFKDIGKKCFAINKIENKDILNEILRSINL